MREKRLGTRTRRQRHGRKPGGRQSCGPSTSPMNRNGPATFSTWPFRTARRPCFDFLRTAGIKRLLVQSHSAVTVDDELGQEQVVHLADGLCFGLEALGILA